jgi:hypothetical protein
VLILENLAIKLNTRCSFPSSGNSAEDL